MQGSQFPESSHSVAETFATGAVMLQNIHRHKAARGGNLEEDVFGGYVRSYGFNYVEGSPIAQGSMWIGFSRHRWTQQIPVTVVILGQRSEDGETGQRIVEKTTKLSELSDLVLDAYFSTYCKEIERYVVVYEEFDCPFFQDDILRVIAGNFFVDEGRYRLGAFWVEKIRSLMDLLEHGKARSVTHGRLADRSSYVLSGGTMKLINVARYVADHIVLKDLNDLRNFIKTDDYFNGDTSEEWLTLDMLLDSGLVKRFIPGWKNAVVGHPMLFGSADDIIAAFDGVYTSLQELSWINKTKLANLLYTKFPYFRDHAPTQNPRQPIDHHNNLRFFFLPRNYIVFNRLFNYTYAGVPQLYGGDIIYLEIIRLARNCIHHGAKADLGLIFPEHMLRMMRQSFIHYISATYSFLHTLTYHERLDGPYQCEAERKPRKITLGDCLFNAAKPRRTGGRRG